MKLMDLFFFLIVSITALLFLLSAYVSGAFLYQKLIIYGIIILFWGIIIWTLTLEYSNVPVKHRKHTRREVER